MRIGIDAREGFRPEPRGIGLYVRHLVREFAAQAQQDEFLLYHQLQKPADFAIPQNMRAVHADMRGERFHLWERLQMPWRMRSDRVDVYHGTYNTLPPRWRPFRCPPMVVTLHDVLVTWWPDDGTDPFVRYARQVTQRTVHEATLVLTVSEWSRRDICERFHCDPAKVRVVHNGLHPDFLAGAPQGAGDAARVRWADGRRYLFSPGAPLERKNTGRLIDAFGMWKRRHPGVPHALVVSGLGKSVERFQERAQRAGCLDDVCFVPYVPRHELVALYAGADLAVYPSQVEGWGIPVTEALALGTPVATSNTSAMPEAGGEFATYFDPSDTESVADGLARAFDSLASWPQRRDAAIARTRQFRWDRAAQLTLQAYRDIAR